jgi:hypothetical protein
LYAATVQKYSEIYSFPRDYIVESCIQKKTDDDFTEIFRMIDSDPNNIVII